MSSNSSLEYTSILCREGGSDGQMVADFFITEGLEDEEHERDTEEGEEEEEQTSDGFVDTISLNFISSHRDESREASLRIVEDEEEMDTTVNKEREATEDDHSQQ